MRRISRSIRGLGPVWRIPGTGDPRGARVARRRDQAVSAAILRVEADAASRDAASIDVQATACASPRQSLAAT